MSKIKVVLYTAGEMAKKYIKRVRHTEIVAVFDNDKNKWGKDFYGHTITKPTNLYDMEYDYIVIASAYDEIKKGIIDSYPELENIICTVDKAIKLDFLYGQYIKIYGGRIQDKHFCLDNKKVVVYTGIFGNYDNLQVPLYKDKNVDYICYTDDKNLTSDDWKIIYVEDKQESNALTVRKFKCLPHRFLSEYDISIWIDAILQPKSSILNYISKYLHNAGVLFFPHYERDCVYEEGAANIIQHRESVDKLINQMYKYYKDGYPEHNGLYCGGCIVRDHNRADVIKLMEDWYKEILQTSARDQISLPYVMWKNNIIPDLCKDYIFDNDYFIIHNHNK